MTKGLYLSLDERRGSGHYEQAIFIVGSVFCGHFGWVCWWSEYGNRTVYRSPL